MRFRLLVALVLFVCVEAGLIVYAFRRIEQIARKTDISVFSWKMRAIFSIVGTGILAGLFSTGIFILLEIELFWIVIPIAIAGLIAFLILRKKLQATIKPD